MPYVIRKAVRADITAVCELVKELAEYEQMSDEVKFTPEIFAESIFEKNYARILVCESEGKIIAYAIYFYTFSTFLGLGWMYLEDLYVQKGHRNKGIGKEFFKCLAKICKDKNLQRLEWACLHWNEPGIKFYEKMGAKNQSEQWRNYRLDGENLSKLAL